MVKIGVMEFTWGWEVVWGNMLYIVYFSDYFVMQELRLGANRLTELNASAIMPLASLVLLDLRDNSIRR